MSNLFRNFKVTSDKVTYTDDEIRAKYVYHGAPEAKVVHDTLVLEPKEVNYEFVTSKKIPKLGCLIVGWGGNNGTTLTGAVIANKEKMSWKKRSKEIHANYIGSMTQSSTVRIGSMDGKDVYIPFANILPMVDPNDIVFGGAFFNYFANRIFIFSSRVCFLVSRLAQVPCAPQVPFASF